MSSISEVLDYDADDIKDVLSSLERVLGFKGFEYGVIEHTRGGKVIDSPYTWATLSLGVDSVVTTEVFRDPDRSSWMAYDKKILGSVPYPPSFSTEFWDTFFDHVKRGDYEMARRFFMEDLQKQRSGGLFRMISLWVSDQDYETHFYMMIQPPSLFDLYHALLRYFYRKGWGLADVVLVAGLDFDKLFTEIPSGMADETSIWQHYRAIVDSLGTFTPRGYSQLLLWGSKGDTTLVPSPVDPIFGATLKNPHYVADPSSMPRTKGILRMRHTFDIHFVFRGAFQRKLIPFAQRGAGIATRVYNYRDVPLDWFKQVIQILRRQEADDNILLGAVPRTGLFGYRLKIYNSPRFDPDTPVSEGSQDVVIPSLAEIAERALEGREFNQPTIPGSIRLGKQEATTPVEYYPDDVAGPLTDRLTEKVVLRRIHERRREREMQARKAGQVEELAEIMRDAERQRLRNLLEQRRTEYDELEAEYKRLFKKLSDIRLRQQDLEAYGNRDPGDLVDQEIDLYKRLKEAEIAVAETESALKGGFGDDELRLIESKHTLRHFEILVDQLNRSTDPDEKQQIRDTILQNWPKALKYDWRYKLRADRESRFSQQQIPVGWRTDPQRTALEAAERQQLEETAREQTRSILKRRAETPVDVEDVEEPEEQRRRTEAQIRWALSQVANGDVEAAAALLQQMKL